MLQTISDNAKASKEAVTVAAAAAVASQQVLGVFSAGQGSLSPHLTSESMNAAVSMRRSYHSLFNLIEQHRKLDRSVSEPTSRYKTELCRPYEESGICKYGDKCQFAHGYNELRNLARHPKYKTELCRTYHKVGFCPYGPRCHFVHNIEEARIHNLKVASMNAANGNQFGLGPLLQPLNVGSTLLEQLTHPISYSNPLTRTSSLSLQEQQPCHPSLHVSLHRSSSLGLPEAHVSKPAPLNLSPTFSLGSVGDSISPSSSLSQSPTNSMTSFFNNDESTIGQLGPIYVNSNNNGVNSHSHLPAAGPPKSITSNYSGFNQELTTNVFRRSPSPNTTILGSRTESPLSPGADSRLPIFNKISNTVFDNFDNLKI